MAKDHKISVIILTKNEAETILDCIQSVRNLNPFEILVFDDDSTDDTVDKAKKLGAKIYPQKKIDFSEVRNRASQKAGGKWLLYIDADEIVSPQLAIEILKAVSQNSYSAYQLTRVNYYLGKKWPKQESIIRLIEKVRLTGWFGSVHETAKIDGQVGSLSEPIIHNTHRNLEEMVANTLMWSSYEAELRLAAHHPNVSWWRLPRVMLTTFWGYYIFQGGWQVGTVGLIESVYQSFSMFITYARLWEMQKNL